MILTEKIAKRLGENLKMYRTEKGLTRKQLADVAGVGETVYGRYETGMILAPLDRIFVLADFLKVPVAILIGEDDTTPNVAKIIDDKILEYRLQRAYKQIEFFLACPRNDEKRFNDNGDILIFVPNELKYGGDKVLYKVDGDNSIGVEVAFPTAKAFVQAVEFAEKLALQTQITFNAAFRQTLLLDRK